MSVCIYMYAYVHINAQPIWIYIDLYQIPHRPRHKSVPKPDHQEVNKNLTKTGEKSEKTETRTEFSALCLEEVYSIDTRVKIHFCVCKSLFLF